jgi:hypothetical protein
MNDDVNNDSDEEGSDLQRSLIDLRKCEANDLIVVVVPNVRVQRGPPVQQFATTKVLIKYPVVLAKDCSKYKLELHPDGKGVDLHYPRLPSLDQEGVTDMCTRDFQVVQPGGSAAQFEQMQNRYNALFTTVRTQEKDLIKIASYRFKDGEQCSAEFFNVDPTNRTLDPKFSETKQFIYETVDRNDNTKVVKHYQVVWFLIWELSVVEATQALAEAATAVQANLLAGVFARASLRNESLDEAMTG